MGLLVDGKWHDVWYDTKASQGPFRPHARAQFRNWVTPDGSAGTDRAAAAFAPSPIAITSTSRSRARGRIAR